MTLTDTGAVVALLDADDPSHAACVAAAQRLPAGPLLTTWVCFTEAMYLLGAVQGDVGSKHITDLKRGAVLLRVGDPHVPEVPDCSPRSVLTTGSCTPLG